MMRASLKFFIAVCAILVAGCQSISERPRDSDLAGRYYEVKKGDSLSKIAQKSRVPVDEIMYINGIENKRSLRVGQALFLPDPDPIGKKIAKLRPRPPAKKQASKKTTTVVAKKTAAPPPPSTKLLDFPVPGGVIIREFTLNKKSPYDGIGIKAASGTRVNASLDGQVLFVGDDGTKFGLIVILEHADPYITVYAHLDRSAVVTGQKLKRGELLGYVGQSGGASSPHLHFQIRVGERPKDPRLYLKSK